MEKQRVYVWYIRTSLERYIFYKVFVTARSEKLSDILEFSPQNVIMPILSSTDVDTLAAQDLV